MWSGGEHKRKLLLLARSLVWTVANSRGRAHCVDILSASSVPTARGQFRSRLRSPVLATAPGVDFIILTLRSGRVVVILCNSALGISSLNLTDGHLHIVNEDMSISLF